MTFKCLSCGHIFEQGEEAKWYDTHGFSYPPYEKKCGCPKCRGEFEKTFSCKICGSKHLEDELNGGVCNECIDKYRKDFNACYEVSFGEKEEIKINSLLTLLFEPSDIEAILISHIKTNCPDIDCSEYIDNDISWFGERLAEEVKKDENAKG